MSFFETELYKHINESHSFDLNKFIDLCEKADKLKTITDNYLALKKLVNFQEGSLLNADLYQSVFNKFPVLNKLNLRDILDQIYDQRCLEWARQDVGSRFPHPVSKIEFASGEDYLDFPKSTGDLFLMRMYHPEILSCYALVDLGSQSTKIYLISYGYMRALNKAGIFPNTYGRGILLREIHVDKELDINIPLKKLTIRDKMKTTF